MKHFYNCQKLGKIGRCFRGVASGANAWAALQRAKVIEKGKTIVTLICDSELKYLNGDLYT